MPVDQPGASGGQSHRTDSGDLAGIRQRLDFSQITPETCELLRELRPLVAAHLPAILDEFYAHMKNYPQAARLFADPAHMRHAKEMQVKHWDTIAAAEFDDTYVRSVTRIGEAHNRLGLDTQWYIGGYGFILARLLQAVERTIATGWRGAAGREKKSEMLTALTRAALLDMD
jgi:hemoglobin-like flavoprotein